MEAEKTIKKPSLLLAAFPVIFLVAMLYIGLVVFESDPHIPLLLGTVVATAVAVSLGHKWKDIEDQIIKTISLAMQANLILMTVGILIGVWIMSGTVPAMIYYGLKLISPGLFLVTACIICCIVSLATGSSWSTAGTVGVALIGVAQGLGINPAMAAGAIISGAYFGDKMSPLSDTTNLAPAMAGSTLFDHIRHMIYTTGPSLLIALVIYFFLGMGHSGMSVDTAEVQSILDGLKSGFNISVLGLIPPVVVIAIVVLKVPALPGLFGGIGVAMLLTFLTQGGFYEGFGDMLGTMLLVMNDGFEGATGHEMVDELISSGGLQSMMWTISLILCAMTFGGVMEMSGCLNRLAESLLGFAKGTGSLVLVTLISCILINVLCSDQFLAIVIPGRMYREEFRKRGLHPKNLSRCLEDSATLTSPLVPWNTCGATMSGFLGVPTIAYAPFCFLNYINPIISAIYGFTGITMEKLPEEELAKIAAEQAGA